MIQTQNIHPLTEFRRNPVASIKRLRKSGLPEVLTVKGRAELVVQTADAYQALLDKLELYESAMAIQRGLRDATEGKASPLDEVNKRLRAKFFQPGKAVDAGGV